MRTKFFSLKGGFYFLILLMVSFFATQALKAQTAYNPGKLAVLVVGDGTAALSSAATPVFIKEFNTSGSAQTGTLRTTLPTIATTGTTSVSRALTQSGSSTSEGMLNLSADRQFLTLTGYNTSAGTAGVSTSVTTTFPTNTRVIAKVNAAGVADTKTTLSIFYSATAIRSAITSDGTAFWTAGAIGNSYVTNGNIGAVTSLSTTNTRGIGIFNNQLYISSQSATIRLAKVGTGMPISGTPTLTNLSGFLTSTGDPYSFVFIDINGGGPDLLYVASLSTAPSGLLKYSSTDNGATWTARGSLTGNVFGVTGAYNPCTGDVDLYITANTTNAKPNALYKFIDLDVLAGSPSNITSNGTALSTSGILLATAATNTAFGGVAFTPGTLADSFSAGNYITGPNGCDNPGVLIGLSDSETGVSYQLYNEGSPTGAAIIGTGSEISFGTQHVSGVYTVLATNLLTGCSINMNGSRFINAAPTINFTGLASSYCINAPIAYLTENTVNGNFSGPGISGTTFNPSVAGVGGPYTITYSYTNPTTGCISISSQTVTVNPLPVVSFTGLGSQYCITASPVTLTGSPAGGTFSGPGINGNVFDPALAGAGGPFTITYLYTNTETGCSDTYAQQVSVNALPTVSISATSNTICVGSTVNLTLNFTGTGPWNYSINGAATVSTSNNAETVPVNPADTTIYYLTSLSDANCSASEWLTMSTGSYHSLAINRDGTLWAWGRNNNNGQLGDGTIIDSNTPVKIGSSTNWAKVSAGAVHSLAIKKDGTLWAWGSNTFGQLGDGTTIKKTSPIQIGTSNDWAKVEGGHLYSLAIKTDGTLWAWGQNFDGQLGDGTYTVKTSPVQIGSSTDWSEISGGIDHSIAIKTDGTLWAWGTSVFGQAGGAASNIPIQVGTSTDWASVFAGVYYSLGIKTDGTLWAWGRNSSGELGNGTYSQVNSPVQIGSATNWARISGHTGHSMGLKQDGTLWAWGLNSDGQLGNGTTTSTNTPAQIGTATNWISISAGLNDSHGMKTGSTIWSWGLNDFGQIGDNTNITKSSPVQVNAALASVTINVNPLPVVSFSGLASSYCVNASLVTLTGSPAGGTFSGVAVTDNTFNPAEAGVGGPYTITYFYTDISTGCNNSYSQIVSVNALPTVSFSGLSSSYCVYASPVTLTGSPAGGVFTGPGITGNTFDPSLAGTGGPYTVTYSYTNPANGCSNSYTQQVSVNVIPTVAISATPITVCAGNNANLTLNFTGIGPWSYSINGADPVSTLNNPETIPVNPVATTVYKLTSLSDANCISNEWINFSADYGDSHGIKAGGTLWGWGSNSNAELGNGTGIDTNLPVQIGAASNWKKISSGQIFSLAIKNDGTLWAWGYNSNGQLGDGTNSNRSTPVQIGSSSDWVNVFCTPAHTLAIKTNGTLWAWGLNNNGQLGDGTNTDKNSPVQIGSSTDWADVSGGTYFSLGIKTNGTIWAWGASFNGQLGGGTNSVVPVQRGIATDWAKISAGDSYSLAIKTNGTLWAWGYNGNGQLGDGTNLDKNTPVQIGSATNWASISAARFHSMGIRQDGTLWAWGLNDNGQLGDGSNINKNSPVQIGSSTNWSKIIAGYLHSLGIKTNGTLWAWGDNLYGQLGNGNNIDNNIPAQLTTADPSVTVTVNPLPAVSFSGLAANYCVNAAAVTLTGSPAGGTFSGPGISGNVFNPAVAGASLGVPHIISYSYTDIATGCSNSISQSVIVYPLPVVSIAGLATQYCINASPVNLTGSPAGGTFSGPGINGNTFDPSIVGIGGPYTITYSFTDILTGCSNTTSQLVSVTTLPSVSISGNDFVCSGGSALLTATANPGSGSITSYQWVKTTLVGSINLGTNATQLINSGGDYTVIVTNSFGCSITSVVFNVTSYAVPSINFSGLASQYCINAGPVILYGYLFGNQTPDGTFSGPGITNNGNGTAVFNPALAGTGGPYTIIYSYTYPGTTCSNSTSQTVMVNALPVVSFNGLASIYCANDPALTLTGSPAGGTFSGPGITGNTFNPAVAGTGGPYIITYTYIDPVTGCSNTSTNSITISCAEALVFDGVNDNVALPNSLAVSATDNSNTALTIEYWFKGSNVQSAVRFQDDNGYIVAGWNSSGQPIHIISTDNSINGVGINPSVNDGNWHHVAMTWQKNTINGFKSYFDGQLFAQRNSSNVNLPVISSGAKLGSYRSVGEFMNGQLDEVRIWNRALCQEEILSNIHCEIPGAAAGLLANYHFNHGVAGSINTGINILSDVSSNNYNGVLNNFALSGTASNWIAPGAVISGVSCSGIIAAQEINVQGNAVSIADNSITPTVTDHTDFGNVISGGSLVRTFTIQNTGTASLTISGIAMTGTNQSMFTIGALSPASPIAPGNSATFTVTFSATSPGTKTATVVIYNNDCNESVYDFAVEALSVCPTVSFTGLATTYCSSDLLVTLTGNPAGGIFSGPGISGNSFDPAAAGAGTHSITYTYSDGNGCSNSELQQVTVSICTPVYTTLNLTAFLEGFYSDTNTMRANIYDLGISTDPAETDTITVNLWSPESLSNTEPDHSIQAVLHTNGTATMQFPATASGNSFYIAVKHRNHIETWSRLPVTFTSTTNYNFSTGTNMAYDDGVNAPMATMPGEVYVFYSGDVNQDGGIDASDLGNVDNDNSVFAFGYNATDANGDGGTDASDLALIDNNSQLFLFYARPF